MYIEVKTNILTDSSNIHVQSSGKSWSGWAVWPGTTLLKVPWMEVNARPKTGWQPWRSGLVILQRMFLPSLNIGVSGRPCQVPHLSMCSPQMTNSSQGTKWLMNFSWSVLCPSINMLASTWWFQIKNFMVLFITPPLSLFPHLFRFC